VENEAKIINLMQFARKAGKLICGLEATIRGLNRGQIHVLVAATDTSAHTLKKLNHAVAEIESKVKLIQIGSTEELSQALGLPYTAIYGVADKNFAVKITEYWTTNE